MPVSTVTCTDVDTGRKHLARMRCLKACVECLSMSRPLPEAIAYIPAQIQYQSEKNVKLTIYDRPTKNGKVISEFVGTKEHTVWLSGEELSNTDGRWGRLIKVTVRGGVVNLPESAERWLEMNNSGLMSVVSDVGAPSCLDRKSSIASTASEKSCEKTSRAIDSWLEVIEHEYAIRSTKKCVAVPAETEAVGRLRHLPNNWTLKHDEDLVLFLSKHLDLNASTVDKLKDYVDKVEVSSRAHRHGHECLSDGNPETYWESSGRDRSRSETGIHWIRLHMKKGLIVSKLVMMINEDDSSYMPSVVSVFGGDSADNLTMLKRVTFDRGQSDSSECVCLTEQTEYFAVIELKILECNGGGFDTRVRGLRIDCGQSDGGSGINRDIFIKSNLVRHPTLESFDFDFIYRRALMLSRIIKLLDSVLIYMVPTWEYSEKTYSFIESIQQLLPLSKKRIQLVEKFIEQTKMSASGSIPTIYMNRVSAAEHRKDPSKDPEYQETVFSQIYEALKLKDSHNLHYRWGLDHAQWWKCMLIGEGASDAGGPFRDSLSDLSDELCPCNHESVMPTPFFVRTPNQRNQDANANMDTYVPNPSCKEYAKYEWIGKLMGACLRGKEFLVLYMPPCFWKQLSGQQVSWATDFYGVDAATVKAMKSMMSETEDAFRAYPRTWSTELSDGSVFPLRPDGASLVVEFKDRAEYLRLVKDARLSESKKQIDAIRNGLLQVIPQAVLDLLTCQELEERICGSSEITIDALKKNIVFETTDEETPKKHFWTAMENFSNEDRSKFIRFVTGRRRLPAQMVICWQHSVTEGLPTSATCASTLSLPKYSSAKIMEEKLRYTVYNCMSIDTDTQILEEE